ncbi:MAG: hypothetical protein IT260_11005 [Saprospiraceae bacterium]|nr:hypothetical protein [Saprospiraceae bacterium]
MTKRTVLLVLLLTFALSAFAQTTEKTFTKSFNTEGKTHLKFDLPGTIDLKVWNSPSIRIEIFVSLPAGNVSMLDQLAKVGRYNLTAAAAGESLNITAPNLYKVVKVKGEELHEKVSYVVFVPKDMQVEMHTPTAAVELKK